MTDILDLVGDAPEKKVPPGQVIIEQDRPLDRLFILKDGEIEIVKDGTAVCRISKPGSTFGEMSALLGTNPTASVVTVKPSTFFVIENATDFLARNSEVTHEIARLLAHRVRWLTANYARELDDGDSSFWRFR